MPESVNQNPELKGKFKVKTHCRFLHSSLGYLDFQTMTAETAEKLCKIAPEYIEKVKGIKKPVKISS